MRLNRFHIKNPCPKQWEELSGGGGCRYCSQCDRTVHDLSMMSRKEAEELMRPKEDEPMPCVKLIRGDDGRVLTAEGEEKRWWTRIAGAAAGLVLASCSSTASKPNEFSDRSFPVLGMPDTEHQVEVEPSGKEVVNHITVGVPVCSITKRPPWWKFWAR